MTCDRCAALQDEVTYLRLRLAEQLDHDTRRIVMRAFGLTLAEAGIVTALHQARGALQPDRIAEALSGDHAMDYAGNTVQVHVMRIRRKTQRSFIETYVNLGYALSDDARRQIASAMAQEASAALAAAPEPQRPPTATWDAKRLGDLSRLHFVEGRPFSEVARRMGLSRNACISAANRYLRQPGDKPYA